MPVFIKNFHQEPGEGKGNIPEEAEVLTLRRLFAAKQTCKIICLQKAGPCLNFAITQLHPLMTPSLEANADD